MIIEYKVSDYEQLIDIREKKMVYFTCNCPDFIFRKIQQRKLCKHLRKIEEWLDEDVIEK